MAKTPTFDRNSVVRNYIINGGFDYWQRNTSFSSPSSGTYTSDRWVAEWDGTIGTYSISRQAFALGQTAVPDNPNYFLRWAHTAAGSGSTVRAIKQRIESVETLAGKTATISFWAKADSAQTLGFRFQQFFGTGGSPSAQVNLSTTNLSLTTTWTKFIVTAAIPSVSGKALGSNGNDYLAAQLLIPNNTVCTIDIAQVMLNEGNDAAPFVLAGIDLSSELRLCQRFYEKSYSPDIVPGTNIIGSETSQIFILACGPGNGLISAPVSFKVQKRTSPTMSVWDRAGNVGKASYYASTGGGVTDNQGLSGSSVSPNVYWTSLNAPTGTAGYSFAWVADAEL